MNRYVRWKYRRADLEAAATVAYCNDTAKARYTGYDHILEQLDQGYMMAAAPIIQPVDAWQWQQYVDFQNAVIARSAERRPPGNIGYGGLAGHFERTREPVDPRGDYDTGEGE